MKDFFRSLNKGLSFVLELAMLAAFCYWGFLMGKVLWLKLALGIGIPIVIIILWSFLLAPRAKSRLGIVPGSILSAGLFITSSAALSDSNLRLSALFVAIVAVLNLILKLAWKQW